MSETPVAAICGENPLLPAARVGCGELIIECRQVYRCTDCDTPFHKGCAQRHFASSAKPPDGAAS